MDKKLALLQSVAVLSLLATEATVLFDDVTDKMEETAGLRDQLRISEEEVKGCEGTLRKIMDRCFDLRGALRQEVLAALSQLPTEEGPQNLASTGGQALEDVPHQDQPGNLPTCGLLHTCVAHEAK